MNNPSNKAAEPTQGTRSVTILLPEEIFLLTCFIQASNKYSRSKLTINYVAQHLANPNDNLHLGFAHQENRSLTVSLPIDMHNKVYENATREGICEGELIKRLLVEKISVKLQELAKAIIEELKLDAGSPGIAQPQDETQIETIQQQTQQDSAKVTPATVGDEIERFLADFNKSTVVSTDVDIEQAINDAFTAASHEDGVRLHTDGNQHQINGDCKEASPSKLPPNRAAEFE